MVADLNKSTIEPDALEIRRRQIYLSLVVFGLSFWIALEFMTPLAWAAVLAIAEWPLYKRATKRFPGKSGLLAFGFTLATALLVIVPLSLAAVTLVQESQGAMAWLKHAQQFGISPPGWLPGLPLVGNRAMAAWQDHIGSPQSANALLNTVSAASILGWTQSVGGDIARGSALFLIALLALVSLLARGADIAEEAQTFALRMFGPFGGDFLGKMIVAVRATVNGTVLVSVAEGVLVGVGYAVAGVPQPLLFATFTVVFALVPFGAWLIFGLASVILLSTGHVLAGGLLFAFGAMVMTIGDNVIQPSVIGSAVELPFILAMVGAFGGLAELGLVGLFVGPVIMVALLLVLRQWRAPPVSEEMER